MKGSEGAASQGRLCQLYATGHAVDTAKAACGAQGDQDEDDDHLIL